MKISLKIKSAMGSMMLIIDHFYVQFQELEELGYHAFAFGTYGDAVELVGTTSALNCCSPQIVQHLSAVLIAGRSNYLT